LLKCSRPTIHFQSAAYNRFLDISSVLLAMNKISLVLFCLACAGHGRRVHSSLERRQDSALKESQKPLTTAEDAASSELSAEEGETNRQFDVKGKLHTLKALTKLLASVNPGAQYAGAGKVQEVPPWWERLWKIELFDALIAAINAGKSLSQFPVVTTLFIGLNFLGHYLQDKKLSVYEYGLLPIDVWQKKWRSWQLAVSSFLHLSLEHLVADMLSLFIQGTNFEELMQPAEVLKLMIYSAIAPNALIVLGTYINAAREPTQENLAAFQSIYIDFSGALMCLDSVWQHQVMAAMGHKHSVYGIQIPIEFAFVDIIIQKLLNPAIPVLREVAALVAGMTYVYVPKAFNKAMKEVKKMSPIAKSALISGVLSVAALGLFLSGNFNLAPPAPPAPRRRPPAARGR